MRFKVGVYIRGATTHLLTGLMVLDRIYEEHGYRMTVTSMSDGKHSLKSKHYTGNAADLRTKDVPDTMIDKILYQAQRELPTDFDIVLEGRGSGNEHFHLEYDPKGQMK